VLHILVNIQFIALTFSKRVLNYVSIFTTPRERSTYVGLIGLVWGIGAILGPVIGGAFADSSATWRWAFYINLVVAAITAPVYILWTPSFQPSPNTAFKTKLANLDWVGIVLNAAVYVLFLVTLTFAGSSWGWSEGRTIALWVVLGIVLIVFVLQQYFAVFTTIENRIFPGQFIKRRTLLLLFFTTASAASSLFITIYYIPLFFQFVNNDSAIEAAVRLLPFIVLNVSFVMLTGVLLPIVGYYMPWYVLSGAFMVVGAALMYTVNLDTTTSAIYGYSILIAIGSGLTQQLGYSIAPAKVKPTEIPAAVGFINVAQLGGIAVALGISSNVFQNTGFRNLQAALAGQGFPAEELRAALAGVRSTLFTSGQERIKTLAVGAIVQTIDTVYVLVIAAGALTLVSALFMKREKLALEMAAGA
jgi:MFS family permease